MKTNPITFPRLGTLGICLFTAASVWCQTPKQDIELFAKGISDKHIYTNQYVAANNIWSGWTEVPGGATTNAALAAVNFQNTLYLFAVGLDSQVYVNHKQSCGGWTGWSTLAAGISTNAAVAPVVFANALFLFVKGTDNR